MTNSQVDLSGAKPFSFTLSFDAENVAARRRVKAVERARVEAEQAAANAEPEEPAFSEAELETARSQAFEEGRAAGIAEAVGQREAGLMAIIDTVGAQLAGLYVHQDVANEKLAADLAELGRTVLSKILPHYLEKHGGDEVLAVLSAGFSRMVHETRITITVNKDVCEILAPRLEAIAAKSGYDGRLKLVPDPDMATADVVVNWGDGRMERTTKDIWNEIDAIMEDAIAGIRAFSEETAKPVLAPAQPEAAVDPEPVETAEAAATTAPVELDLPEVTEDMSPADVAKLVTAGTNELDFGDDEAETLDNSAETADENADAEAPVESGDEDLEQATPAEPASVIAETEPEEPAEITEPTEISESDELPEPTEQG